MAQRDMTSLRFPGDTTTYRVRDARIGELSALETTEKSSIVGAINELADAQEEASSALALHEADHDNPHSVTAEQIGAAAADDVTALETRVGNTERYIQELNISKAEKSELDSVEGRVGEAETDIARIDNEKADKSALTAHTGNRSNPHGVTAEQIGAAGAAALTSETTARQSADNALQGQIDALVSKSDVVDVVNTYADLISYDTTKLGSNDVVKVLSDSTHAGGRSYYRWIITAESGTWTYVGTESVGYTKAETDALLNQKASSSELTAHTGNTSNPHSVTAQQIGAAAADDVTALGTRMTDAESDIEDLADDLDDKEDASNKVTAMSAQSTDTQYPSAKAVYSAVSSLNANKLDKQGTAADAGKALIADDTGEFKPTDLQKNVKYAEYGVTDFSTIARWIESGIIVLCWYNNILYLFMDSTVSTRLLATAIRRATTSSTYIYTITVSDSDVWTPVYNVLEMTSNKVTSLSSESSNTQYPSAKCVYDFAQPRYTTQTVTIAAASWSNNTVAVNVTGVTADNLVQLSVPTKADMDKYGQAGVFCSAQGAGTLTFTCVHTPTDSITVNAVIWG